MLNPCSAHVYRLLSPAATSPRRTSGAGRGIPPASSLFPIRHRRTHVFRCILCCLQFTYFEHTRTHTHTHTCCFAAMHLYVYMYFTGIWCCACVKPLFVCLALVLWLGRCGGLTRTVSSLPTLRSGPVRSRRTSHLDRPPGRPCRKSPGLFVLSLSHSLECDTNGGCQSPRDIRLIKRQRG